MPNRILSSSLQTTSRAAFILPALLSMSLTAQAQDATASQPTPEQLEQFTHNRLVDALLLMDRHFRIEETGQYLDVIGIGDEEQSHDIPSSIAATGIGLMTLAVGDSLGVIEDAEAKAIVTMEHLLGIDDQLGFDIPRSDDGWYPHFIDPRTGTPSESSENKWSTIDTALLAAGSAIAARYFSGKSFSEGRGESRVFTLGGQIVGQIVWRNAIKSVDDGLIHLTFVGDDEPGSDNIFATPFDEYAMLPCIAMRGEQLASLQGPAHDLFIRHYNDVATLPVSAYDEFEVIGKPNRGFVAHFTHQFVYNFCNAMSGQAAYQDAMRDLAGADRAYFQNTSAGQFDPSLWGLGAGSEVKFASDGTVERTGYGVAHIEKNPNDTASPAIMAGFAPLWDAGEPGDPMVDLYDLWSRDVCSYDHLGLQFQWRCSARNPDISVERVEAIDFSTMIMGLAGRHPKIGTAFFRHFNL
ncbi:hypothetical protein OAH97_00980 [Octadecabacter sp.]|nr:hypothetical protein [Octadecabacter sp.]